jgi:sugar lactone lactonase YvrE
MESPGVPPLHMPPARWQPAPPPPFRATINYLVGNQSYMGDPAALLKGGEARLTAGHLTSVNGIVLSADGNTLYWSDIDGFAIYGLSMSADKLWIAGGKLLQNHTGLPASNVMATATTLAGPFGMARDGQGNIYFSDTGSRAGPAKQPLACSGFLFWICG